ncbi:MAG: hypothetical protein WCJ35_07090 [Planctomycetota bacterium]
MNSKTIPADAEIIDTYDALREFRDAFFAATMYFLLIIGRHGLSKSHMFEERCRPYHDRDGNEINVAHYVKGNVTPVEAYRLAYEHRNKLLIFDDAERLWANPNGRFLLRDLTENRPTKTVSWRVDNKVLARDGIPKQFDTTSRVCLIMNRFAFGDAAEYDAIADRGHLIYFDPPPAEVHRNSASWYWDQEIHNYIGQHLNLIDCDKLSARTYVKAYERRQKGDWQEFLARRYFSQAAEQWVVALENDPRYRTVAQKVEEFQRRTGFQRATYYNAKRQLRADGQLETTRVPRYVLNTRPPESPDLETEVRRVEEERRLAEQRAEQLRLQEEEEEEEDE